MLPTAYMLPEIETTNKYGEKEILRAFLVQDGQFLNVEEAREFLHQLYKFYDMDGVSEWIQEQNDQNFIRRHFRYNEEEGRFFFLSPIVEARKVRKDIKRPWGFTCKWCGYKWRSSDFDIYYVANLVENELYNFPANGSIVCSESCGELLMFDEQKQYLHERGLLKYFDV